MLVDPAYASICNAWILQPDWLRYYAEALRFHAERPNGIKVSNLPFADGTDYINSFIYFDPLALAGNANDGDNTAVDAWTNNLNGFLLQGDVFNLSIDPEGGVTTDDALALSFIHGKDTRTPENGGISWERNRAGISPRDYTVWVSFTTEVDGVAQTISMTSLQAHKIVFVNHFFSSSTLTFQYAIDGEPYWY